MLKFVSTGKFDNSIHTSENTMVKLMLTKPDQLSPKLVRLWGADSDKLPLTSLTLGQGEAGVRKINEIEYTINVMGRMTYTDSCSYNQYGASDKPGIGGSSFYLYAKTNRFTVQFGLIGPDGKTRARIMKAGEEVPGRGYRFECQLKSTNTNDSVKPELLDVGKTWVMTAPTVAESLSTGNKTNVMGPGKIKNQISFQRYSKNIAGNLSNKITSIEFPTEGGGTTNLWINEEMRQFDLGLKQMNEEHNWLSEYNKTPEGEILLKDAETGEPIPEGAGVFEQVKEQNHDTYGFKLTLDKIKTVTSTVFEGTPDDGSMDIAMFAGDGFIDDFDMALKSNATSSGFTQTMGDKTISGEGGKLAYGAYFTQYRDIKGNTISVKPLSLLNNGSIAEVQRENGLIHPRTKKPLSSHSAWFIDMSRYEGENNVKMVQMKGQEEINKVYAGMSPLPAEWQAMVGDTKLGSTKVDEASFEKKLSNGIAISNTRNCFALECEL